MSGYRASRVGSDRLEPKSLARSKKNRASRLRGLPKSSRPKDFWAGLVKRRTVLSIVSAVLANRGSCEPSISGWC